MNPAHTLTVATYNICHGCHADFDWERIAEPIRSVGADLVGIQEVDMHTRRSRNMDSLRALAEATGLPYTFFAPTMDFDGGKYGTAILSRYPILHVRSFPLPAPGLEPRAVGTACISLPDERVVFLVNTHLSYKSAEVRHAQLREMAVTLSDLIPAGEAVLFTGDFNTEEPILPAFDTYFGAGLGDINGDSCYHTFRDPAVAIDRILYTSATLTLEGHGMVESTASDHNLLWARFSMKSPALNQYK